MTWKRMNHSLKNSILSIGIDVGSVNGAISVVDEDLNILLLTKTPTYQTLIKSKKNKDKLNKETGQYETDYRKRNWLDYRGVGELLKPYLGKKVIFTIEKISSRPCEGEATSFLNGNSLGIFQGISVFFNPIEYYEPIPSVWKADLGVTSHKDTSISLAEDIYQVSLRNYLKRGKVDDIAEALLLSFYGLRQHYIKEGEINGN